ncbi:hypothetical protein [Caballeronia sp. J97]|uniref:hypothetical protein n=1 Tax=Caballeronia sp. J97 TaxID=2805429 RepID=UPI002AB10865|nr:hypothetical protein [Caballeronia sp. J97]
MLSEGLFTGAAVLLAPLTGVALDAAEGADAPLPDGVDAAAGLDAVEGLDAPEAVVCEPPVVLAPPLPSPAPPHAASMKTTATISGIESRSGKRLQSGSIMWPINEMEMFFVMAGSDD